MKKYLKRLLGGFFFISIILLGIAALAALGCGLAWIGQHKPILYIPIGILTASYVVGWVMHFEDV